LLQRTRGAALVEVEDVVARLVEELGAVLLCGCEDELLNEFFVTAAGVDGDDRREEVIDRGARSGRWDRGGIARGGGARWDGEGGGGKEGDAGDETHFDGCIGFVELRRLG
jgi:hypothetical protein